MSEAKPVTPSPAPSKGHTFVIRLGSTLALWAVLAVSLALKLDWLLLALVAVGAILGTWEYFRLQGVSEDKTFTRLTLFISFLYWVVVAWKTVPSGLEHPWWLDAAALVSVLQGSFVLAFRTNLDGENTLNRIFNSVFGLAYTTLLAGFLARLLYFNGANSGAGLLLMVIMVTKFGDMGAYVIGTLFGRKKMIPHISPGKSWEGLIGAFLGSYLAMSLMMWLVPSHLVPLTWTHALILAPLLCVVGIIGDLAESVLKRCHQIKDTGHKLPGIGGVLDLTDSLLFTAPVAYFYLRAIA